MSLVGPCFWLSVPVALSGILHMLVVKKDLFRALKRPLDGGWSVGGERLFGDNKTWRGVVFMVVCSGALGVLQGLLGGEWAARSGAAPLDFAAVGARGGAGGLGALALGYLVVNLALGLGYALGELPNSFVKRRLRIEPGKTSRGVVGTLFLVIDQADSVIAALGLGAALFGYGWRVVLVGTACLTLLHLAINASLYVARVRKNL